MMHHPLKKSSGIALVTVLLVVAAATIAAVSISSHLQVDIRRTENLLRSDQAWLHAVGVESWAKGVLASDFKEDHDESLEVDSLDEEWAGAIADTVEGGEVAGKIIDQQGLFNINNLVVQKAGVKETVLLIPSIIDIDRFKRLLTILELDELQINDLVEALLDWLDEDALITGAGGAEDDYYQALEPPYSAANRLMAHHSELLLVKGITPEIYKKLAPLITALPKHVDLNVNTAAQEVLQSLYKGLDEKGVAHLLRKIEDAPFETLAEFKVHPAVSGLEVEKNSIGIGVKSSYFKVRGSATVGKARASIASLAERTNGGEIKIIHRMREERF